MPEDMRLTGRLRTADGQERKVSLELPQIRAALPAAPTPTHHLAVITARIKITQINPQALQVMEIRRITGRSQPVAERGLARIVALSKTRPISADALYDEWKRRTLSALWGQVYRLRRLGLHV